jgi:hypothetical protein
MVFKYYYLFHERDNKMFLECHGYVYDSQKRNLDLSPIEWGSFGDWDEDGYCSVMYVSCVSHLVKPRLTELGLKICTEDISKEVGAKATKTIIEPSDNDNICVDYFAFDMLLKTMIYNPHKCPIDEKQRIKNIEMATKELEMLKQNINNGTIKLPQTPSKDEIFKQMEELRQVVNKKLENVTEEDKELVQSQNELVNVMEKIASILLK